MNLMLSIIIPATIMIIVGVAIRALAIHRLLKITFVAIWVLACVRLLVPFTIPVSFDAWGLVSGMVNTTDTANRHTPAANPSHHYAWQMHVSQASPMGQLSPYYMAQPLQTDITNVQNIRSNTINLRNIVPVIWLGGAVAMAVYFIAAQLKFRRDIGDSLPVVNDYVTRWLNRHKLARPIQVRQSHKIGSPLTYGALRPVILLPANLDWHNEAKLDYIFAHEYVHIRRFDYLLKALLATALCIHWFNPFVWLMFTLANRDIELACDEAVLKTFGEKSKCSYALTLLNMAENSNRLAMSYNSFSKNAIEERINVMINMKKSSVFKTAIALALVAIVMVACSTTQAALPIERSYEPRNIVTTQDIAQPLASQPAQSQEAAYIPVRNLNVVCLMEQLGVYAPVTMDDNGVVAPAFPAPSSTLVCMYAAAHIGVNMVEGLFGSDLDGATVTMIYRPRTEIAIDVYEVPYASWAGRGTRHDEYSDMFTQFILDNVDVENVFGRGLFNTLREAAPEFDFYSGLFRFSTQDRAPSIWNGVVEMESHFYSFNINAETGELLSIFKNPLPGGAGWAAPLPTDPAHHASATDQHNHDVAMYAMDAVANLGIFEGDVARARIASSAGGATTSFRAGSSALVHVESTLGEVVELRVENFLEGAVQRYGLSTWRLSTPHRAELLEDGSFNPLPLFEWISR